MKMHYFAIGYQLLSLLLSSSSVARGQLIISEIVSGLAGQPKFVELTNCGTTSVNLVDYVIRNYYDGSSTVTNSYPLTATNAVLPAGQSYVISYEDGDALGTSNFFTVYSKNPDLLTPGSHIDGNDAVAIALATTGTIVDVFGVIGTDGTNEVWDYADSYSYRKPGLAIGPTSTFNDDQWIFGGASLWNAATTAADIVAATTPGWHTCLAIPDIQGSGIVSPMVGREVWHVTGIVTYNALFTFYLQDSRPGGDGDDATSDALVVLLLDPFSVAPGDLVSVSGIVAEALPYPEFDPLELTTTQIGRPDDFSNYQRSNSGNPFFDSRLPLAATFTFLPTGYVFEMVNNHWSSKINSAPTMGTEQPFEDLQEDSTVNGALDRRQEQSAAIKAYVTGKDNVIVLGTLNDYEFVSPVAGLGDVMTILTNAIAENERYSYINQGNSEALDHILVSKGMTATSEYVHVNTELEGRASTTSDHDPMMALVAAPEPPSGMPSRSPSARPARDDPVSRPVDHDDDDNQDGCTNITIKNFFWKWIVCLLKWLFGKKWK